MPSTDTIPYDQPVADYIAGLDATGHVTHQSFTKKSVTLHHNGGVDFSHDTILNIWKTRPASAHFDVDAAGSVAQYVRVNEYAWAVANTTGNEETISIEMADATGDPTWQVSDTTWKAAARLAAWLFANVIHARPDASNYFVHHHWFATGCAGPYIDSIWPQVLAETQRQYDTFTHPATSTTKPAAAPALTEEEKAMADLSNAEVLIGKDKDGKDVYWTFAHVVGNLRGANGVTQAQVARVEALVNALAAKMLTADEVKAAVESANLTITSADVSLTVTPTAPPAA